MYARSTTIQANVSAIEDGVGQVRDVVLPELQAAGGFVGLSMLADRGSGRCIATSSWESLDAMRASEYTVRPLRHQVSQLLGGTPHVEEWEIAFLHRDHRSRPGACVRATWLQTDAARLDRAIDAYKMGALPAIESLEGFCSASLLVDRGSGRAVSSVAYDNVDAMRRSDERAARVRTSATEDTGAHVMEVCEFELVLAHLRVPELA
ncbi:hypothetical protein [Amycolatopsis benzoatilytica]|uniref:hypothetical protein n=1 Tax=Amycolatopsis benzoatilytica TaxID=346045 RepID=UPI000373D35B|nr:hypothetical protein [Amycolatopsis benzoatilytica]